MVQPDPLKPQPTSPMGFSQPDDTVCDESWLKADNWEESERLARYRDEIERDDRRKRRWEEKCRNQSSAKRRPCQWCGGPLTAIKAAATAMRHSSQTQRSHAYDKGRCDRLTAAAVKVAAEYAATFEADGARAGHGSS